VETIWNVMFIGICATATMDAWSLLRQRLLNMPRPDFASVGRWIGHIFRGRFRHMAIGAAAPVRYERALGWSVHYAIGVAFAALLVVISGPSWVAKPTLAPALMVGIGTVAAPFLLMMPGMGAGLAGRRTPRPMRTCLHSLINHAVFGFGLYAAATVLP
jgi:hypothetical protein